MQTRDIVERLREPMSEMDWDAATITRIVNERIEAANEIERFRDVLREVDPENPLVRCRWQEASA